MVQDWPELTKLLTGRHRETGPDRFPRVKAPCGRAARGLDEENNASCAARSILDKAQDRNLGCR